MIRYNIKIEPRVWCSSEDSPCYRYYNKKISRKDLDAMCEGDGYICYESKMLRDWEAFAGHIQNGENKGTPMTLKQVKPNSLCVLTTRIPNCMEKDRCIFAVFLVDETYEGDEEEAGYVHTESKYKIKLSPKQAQSILFWNYYANSNNPEKANWGSGLHRYLEDKQAAQILRDVAKVKVGTADEKLALDFYNHFCKVKGIDDSNLGGLSGALKKQ